MATVYADEIRKGSDNTLQATALGDRTPAVEQIGSPNVAILTYTMDGTEAANDIVRLTKLKAGSIILPHLSLVTSDAIAATATIDIGDDDVAGVGAAVDADRYADGLDVAAAGIDLFSSVAPTTAARTTPYALGADSWIELTFATLVTPVAGKKLKVIITYVGA